MTNVQTEHQTVLETTVQLAHLVVIFHPDRYQTVLTYQGRFPGVNITLVLRQGFQFPALLSVDGFFAQERVRILVHVAAAHVVVGKVLSLIHILNFNSLLKYAHANPRDGMKDKVIGYRTDFPSNMFSWVAGLNYDYRTSNDKFLNSFIE